MNKRIICVVILLAQISPLGVASAQHLTEMETKDRLEDALIQHEEMKLRLRISVEEGKSKAQFARGMLKKAWQELLNYPNHPKYNSRKEILQALEGKILKMENEILSAEKLAKRKI